MKISLTNIEITNIMGYVNSDNSIMKNTTMKFTMEFAWKFRKNVKKIADAYDIFTKLQEEIMQSYSDDEHSELNEDGNRMVKPEFAEEYSQKMNDLYLQETSIDIDYVKLDRLCLGGIEGMDRIELSIPELEVLSFMIDDRIEENKETENNDDDEDLAEVVE